MTRKTIRLGAKNTKINHRCEPLKRVTPNSKSKWKTNKNNKKVKQLSRTQIGVSLTKEDRDILKVKEEDLVEVSKHE